MGPPRLYVDFNEMTSPDEVLLSKTDVKIDSDGNPVTLYAGKSVAVYSDDVDEHDQPDNLIAEGVAALNSYGGWTSAAKWLLRIDSRGIRHESDDSDTEHETA